MNPTIHNASPADRRTRRLSLAAAGVVIPAMLVGMVGMAAPASAATNQTPAIPSVTASIAGDGQAKVTWKAGGDTTRAFDSRSFISVNGGAYTPVTSVANFSFSEMGFLTGDWGNYTMTVAGLTPGVPVQFYAQQKANGGAAEWSSPSYSNIMAPTGVAPTPLSPAPQPLGPVNPHPAAKRAQTAKVGMPKKLKKGNQTVILKKATKTNAGQKVVVKVSGGKIVKGKNGKISIKLSKKPGKKVTITLTAADTATFSGMKLVKTYRF